MAGWLPRELVDKSIMESVEFSVEDSVWNSVKHSGWHSIRSSVRNLAMDNIKHKRRQGA